MDKEFLIRKYTNRVNTLIGRGDKNIKSGGVVRKLRRKIMKLEASN